MKRKAAIVAVGVALVVAAPAAGKTKLEGTWNVRFSGIGQVFSAAWSVTFAANGTMSVRRNGLAVIRGTYAVSGNRVTITDRTGPYHCRGRQAVGAYTYAQLGSKLSFEVVRDACGGRKVVLATKPLTRA